MTREEAIKQLKDNRVLCINSETEPFAIAYDSAIKALETLEEFEKAQIITGGRLNGRAYAYKCGLEDGKRKALEQEPRRKMIFNQTTCKDLRDLFCYAVINVFGDATTFLDFIENEEYSITKYDCFINCNGENYIINRETGEYINWYKMTHIGRDIRISTCIPYKNIPKWIEDFLVEFKESEDDW